MKISTLGDCCHNIVNPFFYVMEFQKININKEVLENPPLPPFPKWGIAVSPSGKKGIKGDLSLNHVMRYLSLWLSFSVTLCL